MELPTKWSFLEKIADDFQLKVKILQESRRKELHGYKTLWFKSSVSIREFVVRQDQVSRLVHIFVKSAY